MLKKSSLLIGFGVVILVLVIGIFVYRSGSKLPSDFIHDEETYFVYVYSPNCANCKLIEEDVDAFQAHGSIPLYKKNIERDKYAHKLDEWDVQYTPTLFLIDDGKIKEKVIGADACLELLAEYK